MYRLQEIEKLFQDLRGNKGMNSFLLFSSSIECDCILDARTKYLILIALALYSQCELCIAAHIKSAVDNGVTKDEILDAAMLAVLMGGSPKLMLLTIVSEELEKYF